MVEILKQGQFVPLSVERQIVIIYAGTDGYLDKFPVPSLQRYESELFSHVEATDKTLFEDIAKKEALDDYLKKRLNAVIESFNGKFESTVKKD